jgi:hypothetical protein
VEDLRQPLALAKEVAADETFPQLEQVMAVSLPERHLVLYIETSLPDGFGKRVKGGDTFLFARADELGDEITAFSKHPIWGG